MALGTPIGPADVGPSVTAELSVAHTDRAELMVVCDESAASLVRFADCTIGPVDPVEGSISTGRGRVTVSTPSCGLRRRPNPFCRGGLVLAAAAATGVAEAAVHARRATRRPACPVRQADGVNQAIKHWCADMAVSAEGAFAEACYAAVAVRDGLPGAAIEALIAKYHADEAARLNSEGAVQIHGAMGFTSEATPHRYVYRAHLLGRCLASWANLLDRIVQR